MYIHPKLDGHRDCVRLEKNKALSVMVWLRICTKQVHATSESRGVSMELALVVFKTSPPGASFILLLACDRHCGCARSIEISLLLSSYLILAPVSFTLAIRSCSPKACVYSHRETLYPHIRISTSVFVCTAIPIYIHVYTRSERSCLVCV